jgi:parallel beta-helix repeat protein
MRTAKGDRGGVVLRGDHTERAGFFLEEVSGVLIRGFTITDFGLGPMSGMGESFLLVNAHSNVFEHNVMTRSDMMGATLFNSGRNVFEHNLVFLNDPDEPGRTGTGCGFHVQGPGSECNELRRNVV